MNKELLKRKWAVAMWDYSWAVRRQGRENEYANWDKILDELCERGYNCVRIDAFPHLIGRKEKSDFGKFSILPERKNFMWGCHSETEIEPAIALVQFIEKAKKRNIYIGLSSWFIDDRLHCKYDMRHPSDFSRSWLAVLDLLKGANLLSHVLWVDLCNEFPFGFWSPSAFEEIFQKKFKLGKLGLIRHGMTFKAAWGKKRFEKMREYYVKSIGDLKAKYPELNYTFSTTSLIEEKMDRLDLSNFDLIEPHVWITDNPYWSLRTGQIVPLLEFDGGVQFHYNRVKKLYPQKMDWFKRVLRKRIAVFSKLSRAKNLPLITTEGWGPTNYLDLPDQRAWDWVKDISEAGVLMSKEAGWTGICTNNFCQPHFRGIWSDVAWHQKLTKHILMA